MASGGFISKCSVPSRSNLHFYSTLAGERSIEIRLSVCVVLLNLHLAHSYMAEYYTETAASVWDSWRFDMVNMHTTDILQIVTTSTGNSSTTATETHKYESMYKHQNRKLIPPILMFSTLVLYSFCRFALFWQNTFAVKLLCLRRHVRPRHLIK